MAAGSNDPGTGRVLSKPGFAQPEPTADPTTFKIKHASDTAAYAAIDKLNAEHKLAPVPFPAPRGGVEPILTLAQVLGGDAAANATVKAITANGQIVFHSGGDCGSTRGPKSQNEVADKMVADFDEVDKSEIPQFHLLLGDVVYSFGEVEYYYDQFYEPYRDYGAPILSAAGNHDGMVPPTSTVKTLYGFLRNFCQSDFVVLPEAGNLNRTAQIQPGVFFTFEAPFVRILVLYSNVLEDPGVISGEGLGNSQITYLKAALTRYKSDVAAKKFSGALLIAHHHPPYSAGGRHSGSPDMQAQIDAVCQQVGVWPHADLSGHAHNQQRFTRLRKDGTQIPYVTCGNLGHGLQKLQAQKGQTLRAPQIVQKATAKTDQITFESYDDTDYGYLRIIVNTTQLRIEYHPASDGATSKVPDDFVTVDLATRKLVHYAAPDLGRPAEAAAVHKEVAAAPSKRKR
jgi:hypothetical protein